MEKLYLDLHTTRGAEIFVSANSTSSSLALGGLISLGRFFDVPNFLSAEDINTKAKIKQVIVNELNIKRVVLVLLEDNIFLFFLRHAISKNESPRWTNSRSPSM